jgi:hypothetical protein
MNNINLDKDFEEQFINNIKKTTLTKISIYGILLFHIKINNRSNSIKNILLVSTELPGDLITIINNYAFDIFVIKYDLLYLSGLNKYSMSMSNNIFIDKLNEKKLEFNMYFTVIILKDSLKYKLIDNISNNQLKEIRNSIVKCDTISYFNYIPLFNYYTKINKQIDKYINYEHEPCEIIKDSDTNYTLMNKYSIHILNEEFFEYMIQMIKIIICTFDKQKKFIIKHHVK